MRNSNSAPIAALTKNITQSVVYCHPSVDQLTNFIAELVTNPSAESLQKSHEQAIEEMIEKYSQGFDGAPIVASGTTDGRRTQQYVLLTGSTGNLGAQMLESLLSKDEIERVYTLNRPSSKASMLQRHRERFEDKGLDLSLLESPKLVFLEGEASQDDFGLNKEQSKEVRVPSPLLIVLLFNHPFVAWR